MKKGKKNKRQTKERMNGKTDKRIKANKRNKGSILSLNEKEIVNKQAKL